MKKLLLLIAFAMATCGALTACETSPFQQVGHFRADNDTRYFTFYVSEPQRGDSLSSEMAAQIHEHGAQQRHTDGRVTGSFYYLQPSEAPDITRLGTSQAVLDAVWAAQPVITVWIMPTGQVNMIEEP